MAGVVEVVADVGRESVVFPKEYRMRRESSRGRDLTDLVDMARASQLWGGRQKLPRWLRPTLHSFHLGNMTWCLYAASSTPTEENENGFAPTNFSTFLSWRNTI